MGIVNNNPPKNIPSDPATVLALCEYVPKLPLPNFRPLHVRFKHEILT
jgi:hypothetical protein